MVVASIRIQSQILMFTLVYFTQKHHILTQEFASVKKIQFRIMQIDPRKFSMQKNMVDNIALHWNWKMHFIIDFQYIHVDKANEIKPELSWSKHHNLALKVYKHIDKHFTSSYLLNFDVCTTKRKSTKTNSNAIFPEQHSKFYFTYLNKIRAVVVTVAAIPELRIAVKNSTPIFIWEIKLLSVAIGMHSSFPFKKVLFS